MVWIRTQSISGKLIKLARSLVIEIG